MALAATSESNIFLFFFSFLFFFFSSFSFLLFLFTTRKQAKEIEHQPHEGRTTLPNPLALPGALVKPLLSVSLVLGHTAFCACPFRVCAIILIFFRSSSIWQIGTGHWAWGQLNTNGTAQPRRRRVSVVLAQLVFDGFPQMGIPVVRSRGQPAIALGRRWTRHRRRQRW